MRYLPKGGLLHIHLAGAIPVDAIFKNKSKLYVKMTDTTRGQQLQYSLMTSKEWENHKINYNLKYKKHKKSAKVTQHIKKCKKRDKAFRYYKPFVSLSREDTSAVKDALIFRACGPLHKTTVLFPDYRPTPYALPQEFSDKFKRLAGLKYDSQLYRSFLARIMKDAWEDNIEYIELMVNPFGKIPSDPKGIVNFFGREKDITKQLLSCRNNYEQFNIDAAVFILKEYINDVNRFNEKLADSRQCSIKKCRIQRNFDFLPESVDVRFLIGLDRTEMAREEKLDLSFKVVNHFINEEKEERYRNKVLGINLIGNEFGSIGRPFDYFKWIIPEKKKEYPDVHITIHAGESAVADGHVLDSILLGAERIGHGLSLQHGEYTEQILKERNICIEACILSNKLLGYVPCVEKHPAKQWLEKDLKVCLNTDDPGIFDTRMTDEFYYATLSFDLSLELIEQLTLESIKSSFLPEPDKNIRINAFKDKISEFYENYELL